MRRIRKHGSRDRLSDSSSTQACEPGAVGNRSLFIQNTLGVPRAARINQALLSTYKSKANALTEPGRPVVLSYI